MIFNLTETIDIEDEKGEPKGFLFPGLIEEETARKLLGDQFFDHMREKGIITLVVDPLPFKGWPTDSLAGGQSDQVRPITQGAKWMIRCQVCGYGSDSAVTDEHDAIASVASAHEPSHELYKATAY